MSQKQIYTSGFSLIEVIVVIAIIAIITGVLMVNYRQTEKRSNLIMATNTVITDVRKVQNKAMGLMKYNGQVPDGGWGVYFDESKPGQYYLFADVNGNKEYDEGEAVEDYGGKKKQLTQGVEITNIDIGDDAHVTFLPPDPDTEIKSYTPSETSQDDLYITLKESHTQNTQMISINFLGLIQVYD